MAVLDVFHNAFKSAQVVKTIGEEDVARLDKRVPPELLELWRERGVCSYEDGLFSCYDPDDLLPSLEAWRGVMGSAVPIGANGLCTLLAWDGSYYFSVLMQFGQMAIGGFDTVAHFNERLPSARHRRDFMSEPLFKKAKKKLGPLAPYETYTIEPAVPLGGQFVIEQIAKVKLPEQLSILSQLQPLSRNA